MKKYFIIALVLLLALVAVGAVSAAPPLEECPEDGGGWTRVNNGHWTEVAGATNYCLKFGNGAAPGEGQGCVAELPIYGINGPGSIPSPPSRCPLNHWAYFIPPFESTLNVTAYTEYCGLATITATYSADPTWETRVMLRIDQGAWHTHQGQGTVSVNFGGPLNPGSRSYEARGEHRLNGIWYTTDTDVGSFTVDICPSNTSINIPTSTTCEQVTIMGWHSSSTVGYAIGWYIDDELVMYKSHPTIKGGTGTYTGSIAPGTYIAKVVGYGLYQDWIEEGEATKSFTVHACHDYDAHLIINDSSCDGVFITEVITDFGQIIGYGTNHGYGWLDPYELETIGPFDFFVDMPDGQVVPLNSGVIHEPTSCQIFRTYKARQVYLPNSCEGIHRVINLYEGPASDPYQTLVGTHYNEIVLFSNPFNLETIPAVTVSVPAGYGPDYTFAAMDEPEDCYSTCDVTTPVVQDPVWGPWSPWAYNPGNGLEESTRTGTQTTLFIDSINEEYVCSSSVEELSDYRSREVEYSLTVVGTGDCFNWEYVPSFTEGGEMSVVGELEGAWMDIYGPEIAPVPTVSVVWPSGYLLTVTPDAIAKDNECIQCLITPYYPQASYHDAAAPGVYWQGPFGRGSGVCNVIHPEGQIPSVGRVTTLCSLCPDVYDGGYIYQVNDMFYDGWVLKVQCYGQETHYTYMGYNWDKYVRGEYTTDGERLSCRVQGCASWVHENAE